MFVMATHVICKLGNRNGQNDVFRTRDEEDGHVPDAGCDLRLTKKDHESDQTKYDPNHAEHSDFLLGLRASMQRGRKQLP